MTIPPDDLYLLVRGTPGSALGEDAHFLSKNPRKCSRIDLFSLEKE